MMRMNIMYIQWYRYNHTSLNNRIYCYNNGDQPSGGETIWTNKEGTRSGRGQ